MNREYIDNLKKRFNNSFQLFPHEIRRKVIQDCFEDVFFLPEEHPQRKVLCQVFKELLEEFDVENKQRTNSKTN